jgi:hypothetical protein
MEAEQLAANKEATADITADINLDNRVMKDVFKTIARAYKKDISSQEYGRIQAAYNKFTLHKELLWTNSRSGNKVVCVPDGLLNDKSFKGTILDSCHQTVGHSGVNRSAKYIRRWFWWPGMADDVEEFCKSCGRCQTTKMPRNKMPGWLHTMPIPARPWESIGMDFTGPFVEVGGYNYILLVICRMTGMVHLIPTQTTQRRNRWRKYMSRKSYGYTEYQSQSCQTETLSSHLNSGRS